MGAAVTAIVVGYEDPAAVREAVRSLLAQSARPSEVLVADNGPDGAITSALAGSGVGVQAWLSGANLGYGAAVNVAAQRARGDWLLLLNPDARAEPDCLQRLLEAADDDTAVVGAQVLLPDGSVNAGDNPIHLSGLSWSGGYGEPREDGPPREVAAVSGAALLVRRSVFEALGGFTPGFFLYVEDSDLCWRARMAGWKVLLAPGAIVHHDHVFQRGDWKWFWLERNRLWMVLSNYESRTLLLLAPLLLSTELAVAAIAAREGWLPAKLRSWGSVLRGLPALRRRRRQVQELRRVNDSDLLASHVGGIETPLVSTRVRLVNPLLERYRVLVIDALRRSASP